MCDSDPIGNLLRLEVCHTKDLLQHFDMEFWYQRVLSQIHTRLNLLQRADYTFDAKIRVRLRNSGTLLYPYLSQAVFDLFLKADKARYSCLYEGFEQQGLCLALINLFLEY